MLILLKIYSSFILWVNLGPELKTQILQYCSGGFFLASKMFFQTDIV